MGERLESLAQQLRRNDIPISRLELSARAYNALKLNGMNYLSEFVTKDLEELKRLDFVTAGVAEELYACVREHRFLVTRGLMIEKEPEAPAVQPKDAIVMPKQEEMIAPAATTHNEPAEPLHSAEPANEQKTDALLEAPAEPEPSAEETDKNEEHPETSHLPDEVTELDDDRPIAVLNLSVRSYNCLMRAKIDTIRKLSKQTPEDLAKIRNMGKKSIDEITTAIISLISGRLAAEVESPEGEAESVFIDTRPIQELGLSKSATDGLLSANITTVQNLLDCPTEALNKVRRLSKRDINEILYILRFLQGDVPDDEQGSPREEMGDRIPLPAGTSIESLNLSVRSTNCLKRAKIYTLKQLLECTPDELLKIRNLGQQSLQELTAIRDKYAAVSENSKKTKYTAEALKALILGVFEKPFTGLSYQEIKDSLPDTLEDAAIKHVIGELIAEKELEYVDYRCYRKYPSFFECLETYLATRPEREQEIVRRRYSGETLEAVAQDAGITRERVRQIQARTDRRLHTSITAIGAFDEDFYETLYTKCYLPESFWSDELNLSQESINYLRATYKCGTENPENLLNDNEIPISLRYRVRSYLDRDKVRIDGILIPRKRLELEAYALRKFAQDELTFEHFTELFNGMLEENGVPFSEKLYYTEGVIRTRVNRLADSMLCLWKHGERLRFYDIPARDYTELYEAINLESYHNTELSTRKLMDLYPSLMERYDIRDPYELHNLLKKTVEKYGIENVQFSRQPMLLFGEFDRNKAIEDAMIGLAPVTQEDLAEYLYLEYGYERNTTLINYLKHLAPYCHNGVYSVDFQHIPEWRIEPLQRALTEDFYYIDEIKSIYTTLFQDADAEDINPRTLKALGFIVNSNYVIQNHSSAEAYFKYLLLREGVYDIRPYSSRYGSNKQFTGVYASLLHQHQIFRFEQNQIITLQRLERFHVSPELIDDYCTAVQDYADDDSYFTIESLRQDGFTHQLDALGFDDYFYASLLGTDERFCSQRVFGVVTVFNGQIHGQFSIDDFMLTQLREYDSIDVDDFIQDISERYGITIPNRYEVINAVKGTELYYDDIMDKIYRSKELYYADIDD